MKCWIFFMLLSCQLPLTAAPLISEFLAANHGPELDDFGGTPDWIEIRNPDATPLALSGWGLSDDPENLQKWVFPAVVLPEGGYLLVRASGRNLRVPGQPLHTNFTLDSGGGFLGLTSPEGTLVSRWTAYPRQFSGISYGTGSDGTDGYFTTPTPEAENPPLALVDYVRDTGFSVPGGFGTSPFAVGLSCLTPGAEIRYTRDGSIPTEASSLYTGPVPVDTTTVLRVRGFKAGWLPSNTDTRTWIFPGTWLNQTENPPGFSPTWGQFNATVKSAADYGMNQPVIQDAVYGPLMLPALTTTLPVLCISGNVEEIFGDNGIHGSLRTTDAEVPVGVEFFNPRDPAGRWSARAALQAHGGAVRNFPKKAFRLDFSGAYGDGALNYPLFPGSKSERFDQLVLRGGGHDSFTARTRGGNADQNDLAFHATYLRDQFLRLTEVEAGLVSPRGRYVHLSINGLYWGLYDLMERPNAAFFQAHEGGAESEWDVVHHGPQFIEGSDAAWNGLQIKAMVGVETETDYQQLAALTGPDRFIDHMLIRTWAADHDWLGPATLPSLTTGTTGNVAYYNNKNWYAARRSRGTAPGEWQFFTWDAEISMGSHLLFRWFDVAPTVPEGLEFPKFRELRLDLTGISQPETPAAVWAAMQQWPAFRLRVADRARRLFGPGGALSPVRAAARVETMREMLDLPMVAESARWGTVSGFTFAVRNGQVVQTWDNGLLTRDLHWRPEVAWLRDIWCSQRTLIFMDQLKARALYPETAPAEIVPHGGSLGAGESFVLNSPAGAVHYTVNGQDPMEGGPGVRIWPAGQGTVPSGSFTVKARVRNGAGTEWSALTEAAFSSAVDPQPGMLAISEIHYHPADPSPEELLAGFLEDGQFEFLELANVSGQPVRLTTLRFAAGIDFDFAEHSSLTELPAGAVLLIAANAAALQQRYGTGLPVAGEFAHGTRLSNSGEQIKLVTSAGVVLADVTYRDDGDWPAAADGGGKSLTLLDPASGFTGTRASAWRPGSVMGGTPGGLPAPLTWQDWLADHFTSGEMMDPVISGPSADPDGDGLVNWMEYAVVGNPRKGSLPPVRVEPAGGGRARITWERRRGSADAGPSAVVLQGTDGGDGWAPVVAGPGVTVVTTGTGEGTDRQTVELDTALMPRFLVRLRAVP